MNKEKIGHGQASGKIILMGEHSVVYGEPAIAIPFQETFISTKVEPDSTMILDCHYYSGALSEVPPQLKSVKEVINQALIELHQKNMTFKITITSTIPAERGMGSSAAVAVSIVRALFDYFEVPCSPETLLHLVNRAEKIAHGNPSGIDAAATSGNEPLFFIKNHPLESFPMNVSNAFLIVADTGIKGQTRAAVSDVAHLFEQNKKEISQHITELGRLTKLAKQAISKDDVHTLGNVMNQAHDQLKSLTVSNDQLDQLVITAREHGAIGAKLTGGGRGGCMIALAESKEQAVKIAAALKSAGAFATWIQSLGVKK
ncbi:mevalonate kinase [Enterococcus haemoperoxidus ATCC BAA-382]|uniref:Mevalonate kinase n=1 Tax=Enterococcus haemoperoxidus ATCC BAA-382 TaxID=1158608 RepID=R2QDH8_9ENTE|nr:mevalonate kinase [Enterococcus haemoperoxidus]EOH93273.1 mevalonate kinase [Enterococcus haemoperoxidus ATCC BAA-382]EOT61228.1 mevalonate kinase [Enterococcus haemoperoxidus ATCC BAA-382]OJG54408.1 mevalonate kinase [Enterococcus haemoperoxidus]